MTHDLPRLLISRLVRHTQEMVDLQCPFTERCTLPSEVVIHMQSMSDCLILLWQDLGISKVSNIAVITINTVLGKLIFIVLNVCLHLYI